MKVVEITEFQSEERKIILLDDNEYSKGNFNEEGEFIPCEEGEFEAYYDERWIDETKVDSLSLVKDYKELKKDYDFYGNGYDRITAIIDGEKVYLKESRWTSGKQSRGYNFVGFAD